MNTSRGPSWGSVPPPPLSRAGQREATGSRPRGWFRDSRTPRAVRERNGLARDQYNRYGAAQKTSPGATGIFDAYTHTHADAEGIH